MLVQSESRVTELEELSRALAAVGRLIAGVRPEQWSAPTPCAEWTVRDVVNHLVIGNLVFAAIVSDRPSPQRDVDHLGADPLGAYVDSGSALQTAFGRPGVFERRYEGPLGIATGADRLRVRIYDLLAHGWDLAHATGQPVDIPEDLAEQALLFVQAQLSAQPRTRRFGPAQPAPDDAPAIDRLVAFLGRSLSASQPGGCLHDTSRWAWEPVNALWVSKCP